MVLKANPATLPETAVRPGFEPMDDDAKTPPWSDTPAANAAPAKPVPAEPIAAAPAAPAANDPAPAPAPAPAAAAPAAAPSAVAVHKAPSAFAAEVTAMKGAADFSYGNYKVFKATNGKIRCGEDKSVLGTWVKVSMLGWDEHTQIAPGSDSPKAKDAVAYSKDGKIIDSIIGEDYSDWIGKKVTDYLDFLRSGDWRLARSSVYIDIACAVHGSDSNPDMAGEIIQVTLSPSSIKSFKSYQEKLEKTAICVQRGIPGFAIPADPFTFYFVCEDASKGDKEWTKLGVSLKQPVKG